MLRLLRTVLSFSLVAGSALLLLTPSCGGGGGGGGGSNGDPVTSLSYGSTDYVACTTIAANTPTTGGGAVTTWDIAPDFPGQGGADGLQFSSSTGVISGTPTLADAGNYVVSASNADNDTPVTANLAVTVASATPAITYTSTAPTYTLGFPITPNTMNLTGSADTVDASGLPEGLSIDPVTGTISGTPLYATLDANGALAPATVTVTATNCALETDQEVLTITVKNPEARAAYLANQTDDTVSIYVQDASTGQLRHNGYVSTGASTGPRAVATTPTGNYLYVALNTTGQIQAYAANAQTGRLTAVGSAISSGGGTGANGPVALAVTPSGAFLYAVNGNGAVGSFSIDSGSGALSATPGSPATAGTTPNNLAIDPTSAFVYVSNNGSNNVSGFSIAGNGDLAALTGSPYAAGTGPAALAMHRNGTFLYCANAGATDNISAYTIAPSTGVLAAVAGSPFAVGGSDPLSLAIDPTGRFLYSANLLGNEVSQYVINAGTGALGAATDVATGSAPINARIDPEGNFLYSVNAGDSELRTYAINATTGALTGAAPFETRTRSGPIALCFGPSLTNASFATSALYAANFTVNDINQYSADASTGALTANVPATVGTLVSPTWIEVHPFLEVAYLTYFNSSGTSIGVFSIDGNGALTSTTSTGTVNGNWATVVDPSGRFAFKTSGASPGVVTPYTIDASTGALTAGTDAAAQNFPRGIAVHPNGKWVYAVNQFSTTLSQYAVNASTGALSALAPATVATGTSPIAVAVDPSGRFAYVANDGGASGTGATDGSISMFSINASTGVLSAMVAAGPSALQDPFDIALTPNGRFLYVADQDADQIKRYALNTNPTNGTEDGALIELAPAVSTGASSGPRALRVNAAGTVLYVSLNTTATVLAYTIAGDGSLTLLDTEAAGTGVRGIGLRTRVQ